MRSRGPCAPAHMPATFTTHAATHSRSHTAPWRAAAAMRTRARACFAHGLRRDRSHGHARAPVAWWADMGALHGWSARQSETAIPSRSLFRQRVDQHARDVSLLAPRILGELHAQRAAVRRHQHGVLVGRMRFHRRFGIGVFHKRGRACRAAHQLQELEARGGLKHRPQLLLRCVIAQVSHKERVARRVVTGRAAARCRSHRRCGGRRARTLHAGLIRLDVHVLARHFGAQDRRLVKAELCSGVTCHARKVAVGEQRKALCLSTLPVHLGCLVSRQESQQVVELTLLDVRREARHKNGAQLVGAGWVAVAAAATATRPGRQHVRLCDELRRRAIAAAITMRRLVCRRRRGVGCGRRRGSGAEGRGGAIVVHSTGRARHGGSLLLLFPGCVCECAAGDSLGRRADVVGKGRQVNAGAYKSPGWVWLGDASRG
mmetsp:Transcript_14018/g.40661  ORF Transcript_14018/g.40661 Transcript_14018/m.40661 type:complete len:431 (-) Transcript_14018:78-1370(-)